MWQDVDAIFPNISNASRSFNVMTLLAGLWRCYLACKNIRRETVEFVTLIGWKSEQNGCAWPSRHLSYSECTEIQIVFLVPANSFSRKRAIKQVHVNRPVAISTGSSMMTVSQLNMSWTVAPAKARRNSSRFVDWASDTIVFVSDVPMFTPMTIGIAGRTGNTTVTKLSRQSTSIPTDTNAD